MLLIRYLLIIAGSGLLIGAAAMLIHDLYRIYFMPVREEAPKPQVPVRLSAGGKLAAAGSVSILAGLSVAVVPGGYAAVKVSQFSGVQPAPLYPGVHWILPLSDRLALFETRDHLFSTSLTEDPKKKVEILRVQTKEGLSVALAVTVRFKLDPTRLPYVYSNLPQPVEQEIVPPVIAGAFRELAPSYTIQELFASRREEIVRNAAGAVSQKLASDGIVLKQVLLRDIQPPVEYAKGMEGLLLKEQENERLAIELEVKQKMVRAAELEAEAQKAREVKEAEAQAQVTVLQAKAQADAMQHTLPLKQKQIEQSRLEAEARKEATVKNAEAMAEAKVIDSKAELERRKLMTAGESDRIRNVAAADAERLKMEADVLKQSPLLIQKIIAEKLSDKVQIMMVPNDGKFFFANDVLKGVPATPVKNE